MDKSIKAKLAAADATIAFLSLVAEEARQRGNRAKLECVEHAIEGETQRRAALDPAADPQPSTFVADLPNPPVPLERSLPSLESLSR